MEQNNVRATIPEKGTNFIAFTDANQAPGSFKGFVKFLSESYIAGALTVNLCCTWMYYMNSGQQL